MSQPQIDIIPSHNIDQQKWNNCILHSSSPLVYACTYYLDHMTDNWSGIILNDYEAVMPVPWRKKYGIQYSYEVPFVQQLGFFSAVEQEDVFFLDQLVSFFKYGDYNFNYQNKLLFLKSRTNFIIDLSCNYLAVKANYKDDLLNNLNKAARQSFIYTTADHAEAIDLYRALYASRMPDIREPDYNNFKALCDFLQTQNKVITRKVVSSNNELLAIALLLNDGRRLYNIANSTTTLGRKTEANHFLFDEIFKEFAVSNLIFDFEGSDIPGVKIFYEKFGAVNQPYYRLHFNKLPGLIKWIKQ